MRCELSDVMSAEPSSDVSAEPSDVMLSEPCGGTSSEPSGVLLGELSRDTLREHGERAQPVQM